ncbi:MAG: hypothetical protein AAB650_00640, partial [Patescibacteria group bacterium]
MTNNASNFEQVAAQIAESSAIAIVLPDSPGMDILGSVRVLTAALAKLEKAVTVFAPPVLPARGLLPWPVLDADDEPLRDLIISFDVTRSPIRELKYERDQNRLNIILSPTKSHLSKEDIEFRSGPLRYDLVITLGVPNLETASSSLSRVPELLHEKPVVNIDDHPANTGYGEFNLAASPRGHDGPATLPELIDRLLAALKVPSDDLETATALLCSLYASTHGFRPAKTTANALVLAARLMRCGGDLPRAARALNYGRSLEEARLAGRAMARSRWDEESLTLWSLLTKDDLLKTGGASEAPMLIMPILKELYPGAEWHVLLWHDPSQDVVRGLLAHDDETRLKALSPEAPL